jgi:diadenosine tetraphosphatase ApaH/serine/threonine PP2A family protein phosphatase
MLNAIMSDIHGNRQAFEACIQHAEAHNVGRYIFLGDYVGYGADPEWVVRKVRSYVDNGALAVVGNHDRAIFDPSISMNRDAELAIEWTRTELSNESSRFLELLPMTEEEAGRLYVHGNASAPSRFHYVLDTETARQSLHSTHAQLTFCGHVHTPAIYSLSTTEKLTSFQPVPGVAIPLLRQRRWLVVVGSVGQPRDGHSAAAYCTFDDQTWEITFHRVPYDVETAAAGIRAAGLPHHLADRLFRGR